MAGTDEDPTRAPEGGQDQRDMRVVRSVHLLPDAERVLEKRLWRTENTRSMLGEALAGLGRTAEAEPLIKASAAIITASADAPPDVKSRAQARLAAVRR